VNPLERLAWREFRKNGLQNLEPQGFAGQNLENTGVMASRGFPARTASALTMIWLSKLKVRVWMLQVAGEKPKFQ
jgi:hypothetical protein